MKKFLYKYNLKQITSTMAEKDEKDGMSSSWSSSIICCIILLIISSIVAYYFYSNPAALEKMSNIKPSTIKLPKKF